MSAQCSKCELPYITSSISPSSSLALSNGLNALPALKAASAKLSQLSINPI